MLTAAELQKKNPPKEAKYGRRKIGDKLLGEKLAALRNKYGLRQEDVAEAIGNSRQMVVMTEGGMSIPTVSTLAKFARFYQVDFNTLIGHLLEESR